MLLAHAYYTRRYYQARRTRSAGDGVHPADPHSRMDAQGLATFAAAAVLGLEEFGADSVMEALRQSLGSEDDEAVSAPAFAEMTAIASQRELSGDKLVGPRWMLTADRARQHRGPDHLAIRVRRDQVQRHAG
ncbi:hypothetical protein [Streptomyces sp. NPDC005525]|uniref:hypothetical protein n=1 Tax=Streptomyces sp. NPDC005525 TaxID=3364720 RepID=UPI00369B7AC7